jgi:hypothetical protein
MPKTNAELRHIARRALKGYNVTQEEQLLNANDITRIEKIMENEARIMENEARKKEHVAQFGPYKYGPSGGRRTRRRTKRSKRTRRHR